MCICNASTISPKINTCTHVEGKEPVPDWQGKLFLIIKEEKEKGSNLNAVSVDQSKRMR